MGIVAFKDIQKLPTITPQIKACVFWEQDIKLLNHSTQADSIGTVFLQVNRDHYDSRHA